MANRRIESAMPGILMTIIERLCNSLIDIIVFHAPPQPLSEDVAHHLAAAIDARQRSGREDPFDKLQAGNLKVLGSNPSPAT